jgi:hypothetical protein
LKRFEGAFLILMPVLPKIFCRIVAMNDGKTVFAQLMSFVSHRDFDLCVDRYDGNRGVKHFSCWDQFLTMSFAQLTYRESLRDIEVCLRAQQSKLYHSGLRGPVKRSTLADANEGRDWRIYQDFALGLIEIARQLYTTYEFDGELAQVAYAFDSTTIDLCMSLYPWAHFRSTKSAVKVHTLLDMNSSIPAFIAITNANVHDVNMLDALTPEPESFIVLDRAYVDFQRLYRFDQALTFFVVRAKRTLRFQRRYSLPVDKNTGVRTDQIGMITGDKTSKYYPKAIRRISYYSEETKSRFVFLTNNFELPAEDIAALYRRRWKVELFFKWIKQHLRIKKFLGTSENSVKTQIWIAVATYVLITIVKKKMDIHQSLYTILQTLSLTLFEKMPITSLFRHLPNESTDVNEVYNRNQLIMFDL